MIVKHLSPLWRVIDYMLSPFMLLLNGLRFPLQETHKWHAYNISPKMISGRNCLKINSVDKNARFSHNAPLGLYHMPIFGGLRKYVVVEAFNFQNHWHVGWSGIDMAQVHKLSIHQKGIKLLTGKGPWNVFGVDDSGRFLKLKIAGFGTIGDGQYPDYRLF